MRSRPSEPPARTISAWPDQRAEIAGSLFSDVWVRDQGNVSGTMAEPEHVALVAVTETARHEPVGLAPPEVERILAAAL